LKNKKREKSVSGMEDKCESYVKAMRYAAEPAYLATLFQRSEDKNWAEVKDFVG
ncbi:hypothetical protein Tco_1535548, partial [Tanacetum coccineum]